MRRSAAGSKRNRRESVLLRIEQLEDRATPTAGPNPAIDNVPVTPSPSPPISIARCLTAGMAGLTSGSASSPVQQSPAVAKSSLAAPAVAGIRVTNSAGATLTGATNVQFGTVTVGQSVTQSFTISNPGSAMLQLTGKPSIQIAGASAGDFQVTLQPYSALVAHGWNVWFSVRFSPKVLGSRTATVVINCNVPGAAVFQLPLAATAVAPAINVTGNTQFGSVTAGQAATQVFTISNPGTAPLVLTGKPLVQVTGAQAGDFTVTQPSVSSIPAGGSTTFSVSLSPKAAGVRTGTISINSNAMGTPSDQFALTGTGLAAAISVSGATQFGQLVLSQSAAQIFTIFEPRNGAACPDRKRAGEDYRLRGGRFHCHSALGDHDPARRQRDLQH